MNTTQKLPRGAGSQQVWESVRTRRRFTFKNLTDDTNVHADTIRDYLKCLLAGGFVQRFGDEYELVRDVGPEHPRVREDGSLVARSDRQKMWQAMRIARVFTLDGMAAHGFNRLNVDDYLNRLARGGILRRLDGQGGKARFQLIKDVGPKAPQIKKDKTIHDPNQSALASRNQRPAGRRGVEKLPAAVAGGAGAGGGRGRPARRGQPDRLQPGGGQPGAGPEVPGEFGGGAEAG
ncbi:MAG: hypothetical protein HQL51_04030 [Magnetococcales bacterium]|nr:hypothetical protein [Magnetococcales bacterium]